jgi:uncharacterized membrane protein YczE
MKNIIKSMIGISISAFGIACVANSDIGAFALTAASKSLGNLTGIPFGVTYMLIEIAFLLFATYKGEGIGWTAILNGTYGSLLIGQLHGILPHHPNMVWCVFLIPVGYSIMGKAGLGETGSNIFTTTIMKMTGWNVMITRFLLELSLLGIGFIAAREYVTIYSLLITILAGPVIHVIYHMFKFKPTKTEHKYLISRRNN